MKKRHLFLGSTLLLALFLLIVLATYQLVFGLDSWLFRRDLQRPADERLLFIGNSFTYQNDIDKMVAHIMEAQSDGRTVFATRVALGGYHLFDHLDDIVDHDPESPIRHLLIDGPSAVKDWDVVVLQEQVETPGLDSYAYEKEKSFDAARMLGELARNSGASVMLLETWGAALDPADPNNPYPEFPILQQQLIVEYKDIAAELAANDIEATIAPVGRAYLLIFNELVQNGEPPWAEDGRFLQLYSEDRQHASLAGSYLAAAVLAASYTQQPVSDADWHPLGLDADTASYLRQVADHAVFAPESSLQGEPFSTK